MLDYAVKVKVQPGMSDTAIRQLVSKSADNGSYATNICRGCGRFLFSLDGHVCAAVIADSCKHCIGD